MSVASTEGFWPTVSAIGLGFIAVATLALIVSKNSNTSDVISSTTSGYAEDLGVALSPVTGDSNVAGNASPMFPIG